MKRLILSFMLVFGMVSLCTSQTANDKTNNDKGELTVKIIGFRNDKGQTCVSIFNNAKGFPGKYAYAYRIIRSSIKNNQATIEFSNLPYGSYAVSVLHDENMNNKLDTSFIGIPKEGCGASNNPRGLFGPPSFEISKVELKSLHKTIDIRIKYF